ncbi:energy transducer TonB [Pendulispora albinea]|uniref:Energy transducer TonB n=1 Tax=Pendulispora albinea TaxID=2741071 RepID=A0ABZ2LR24_9BACT
MRAHQEIKKQATEVKFVAPPPPPPPPPVATAVPRTEKRQQPKKEFIKKPDTIVESKEPPKEDTTAKGGDAEETKPSTCGGPGQPVCCGGPGDPPCRHCGGPGEPACCGGPGEPACAPAKAAVCGDPGMPPCPPTTTAIPFGAGMVRPTLTAGEEQPQLSREALEAKVEGLVIAKCTITTEGTVTNCKLIKTLPFMDEAIKNNLMARKYTPVMFQGHPVSVEYTFTFRIVQK